MIAVLRRSRTEDADRGIDHKWLCRPYPSVSKRVDQFLPYAELPNVVQAYKDYHPKGFEIVSISLDYIDRVDKDAYTKWIDEHEMNWRHTYDGTGWATPLVKDYFVSGIPAAFLVGPDGSLIATGDECRGENLAKNIEKALGSI